ncbi:hypothetical protein BGZ99_006890 [Dissophora globulifera]|uniref:RING-type domain-containing protein n=1 Tax=Dissophora globulifera TaxID=979702 RepID=A0A9P6RWH9_9FUNG|nr:hypothetical protein BGZ99_006890 [Dissophora globulifera]
MGQSNSTPRKNGRRPRSASQGQAQQQHLAHSASIPSRTIAMSRARAASSTQATSTHDPPPTSALLHPPLHSPHPQPQQRPHQQDSTRSPVHDPTHLQHQHQQHQTSPRPLDTLTSPVLAPAPAQALALELAPASAPAPALEPVSAPTSAPVLEMAPALASAPVLVSTLTQTPISHTPPSLPSVASGSAAPAPSRVVHSTTRRRRLLAAFYPLLSRRNSNISTINANNNNNNNNNNNSTNNTNINHIDSRSHDNSDNDSSHNNISSSGIAGTHISSGRTSNDANSNGVRHQNNGGNARSSTRSHSGVASDRNRPRSAIPDPHTASSHPRNRQQDRPRPPSARSQTLPSHSSYTSPNSRTPRGVSRVQRRYDEQSIRSFRSSSSQSSSLLAMPSSSSTTGQAGAPLHQHVRQQAPQSQGQFSSEHLFPEFMDIDDDQSLSAFSPPSDPLHSSGATHDLYADHFMSAQLAGMGSRFANGFSVGQGIRSDAGLFVTRSNPRGGTSISSSLLPIRPDSEDEDNDSLAANDVHSQYRTSLYEHTLDFGASNDINHLHGQSRFDGEHNHNEDLARTQDGPAPQRTGAGDRRPRASRPSRYPPPEIIADLIQLQIVQGLAETQGQPTPLPTTLAQPPIPATDITDAPLSPIISAPSGLPETNNSNIGTEDLAGGSANNTDTETSSTHRRRLRSPSLRGLLGFQPSSSVASREPFRGTGIDRGFTPVHRDQRVPEETSDQQRIVESQLPFLTRLLTDIGRGIRGQQQQQQHGAIPSRASLHITSTMDASSAMSSDVDSNSSAVPTTPSMLDSASPNTLPSAPSPPSLAGTPSDETPAVPRRRTMIRFIQIGSSTGLATLSGSRPRSGSLGSGQGSPLGERNENLTHVGREELAEAILMFLSNTSRPRMAANRREHGRVGHHLSSLLAGAGGEGEDGGLSYDDLWMLSNMIGPARPITTTQEAIDNEGFVVGQFESASRGMRGFEMLGDGSKCLVCMSEYEEGEEMRALRCKHVFHQECIDKWLTTGANKCPVCRAAAVGPSDSGAAPTPLAGAE